MSMMIRGRRILSPNDKLAKLIEAYKEILALTVTGVASVTWDTLTGKPSTFTPSTHGHAAGDVTGTAVLTNDARLSDARTPTTHDNTKHSAAYLTDAASDGTSYARNNGSWVAVSAGGLTQAQILTRGLGA